MTCSLTFPLLFHFPAGVPEPAEWSLPLMGIHGGRYRYVQDLLALEACTGTYPSPLWPVCPTPVRLDNFCPSLHQHPDQEFARYIHQGFTRGFRIGFNRAMVQLRSSSINHPSTRASPGVVESNIQAEVEAGRLVGPLPLSWKQVLQCSPLGLVPKTQPGRFRTIVDLSSPRDHSVNSGISEEICSVSYATLDDAVGLIKRLGPMTQLVKMDLKDAYRMVPIHPHDQHLLAIVWGNNVYVDRCLPFGLRSAPKIFTAVADALAWGLYLRGVRYLLHYLDDFLFIGAPGTEEAAMAARIATEGFQSLGVPIASHKTEGPSSCITFLGIVVDTRACQLRLPEEKLRRLQGMMLEWQARKSCTRKELESLLGHLSYAARVIHPGRVFLRELFTLLPLATRPHHRLRLNCRARADLAWWQCFLQSWNGVSFLQISPPTVHVYSDASGAFGCGAFSIAAGWFQLQWPESWQEVAIAVKEMLPVVVAAALWGHGWSGMHVALHVDNMAVVSILERHSPKDTSLAHLLRCLCFYASIFKFEFSASHIPGQQNIAADALSRNNLTLFSLLYPQVPHSPVPRIIQRLLLHSPPDWSSQAWINLFLNSLPMASPPPPPPHTVLA